MGLLDEAMSLPSVSGAGGSTNYDVVSTSRLVEESMRSMQKSFGGIGSFTAPSVGAPSFAKIGADLAFNNLKAANPYVNSAVSLFSGITSGSVNVGSITGAATGALKNAVGGAVGSAVAKLGSAASLLTAITPTSATASQIREQAGDGSSKADDSHKVTLRSMIDDVSVTFEVMPEITESRTTEYESLQASQMPGEFQKFKGTKAVTWQVNATLTCRTRHEADKNFMYMRTLRTWTMPYFGDNQGRMMGAPPPVLEFFGWRGLVGSVPVVMTSLNWTWPKDCDWIPTTSTTGTGTVPFPTVMTVQFTLVESFSASQFNRFNLEAFASGDMVGAYGSQVIARPELGELETISDADFLGLPKDLSSALGGLSNINPSSLTGALGSLGGISPPSLSSLSSGGLTAKVKGLPSLSLFG